MNNITKNVAIILVTGVIATSGMQTNLLVSNAVAAKVSTTKDRPITLDGEVYQNLSGKQFGKKYKGKFVKFNGLLTSVRPYAKDTKRFNLSFTVGENRGSMFTDSSTPIYMIATKKHMTKECRKLILNTRKDKATGLADPVKVTVMAKVEGYSTVKDMKAKSKAYQGYAVYLTPVKVAGEQGVSER
ncbi:hypothetical protein HAU32_09700 [Weissella confusa]|uniref:Surface layer protein A domain-containing protein n=1 Tax=Weissella fermenti TaxID=2987699 RepID=A0ABT6D6T6_9LACO|nr:MULTISPECIES: hypothetical protein [Weissella]MBJ7689236.1 hypothetical protein [Weissella confusa]MCW0927837.1 hypothetical protein [Weissella sp. LMG 11983]MDF9300863.1 hypothetical protein [Weissella sp. BK2]